MRNVYALPAASLATLLALAAVACSSSSSNAAGRDSGTKDTGAHDVTTSDTGKSDGKGPADAGAPEDSGDAAVDAYPIPDAWNQTYTRPSEEAGAASRSTCTFTRGAMPAETLGPSTALGSDIPIEHIVVFMQENRSFDSYLGHLQAYEATKGIVNTIESASSTATNPSFPVDQADGGLVKIDAGVDSPDAGSEGGTTTHTWQHAPQLCSFDTQHGWGATHVEYDQGLNDGFYYINDGSGDVGESIEGVAASQLTGDRSLWWYDQTDLPFHYDLYSTFAMADHYHAALMGPTWPNRMYLYSGTSFGLTVNSFPTITQYPTPETPAIIFDELAVRGVSFAMYTEGSPGAGIVLALETATRYGFNPVKTLAQFLTDAQTGNLPAVSFIDGDNSNETTSGDDEHPPSEIEIGQHLVWEVVNAVTTSPSWKSTVLFVTYDENGGFYDHVVPPAACEPDNLPPVLTDSLDRSQPAAFNQYGFRVPFVAVSPYSKKSYVSHTQYSHTSITRFIEAKFTLPALSTRDANEDPFTDLFDWQNPPFMTAPVFAEPTINQAAVTACTAALTAKQ